MEWQCRWCQFHNQRDDRMVMVVVSVSRLVCERAADCTTLSTHQTAGSTDNDIREDRRSSGGDGGVAVSRPVCSRLRHSWPLSRHCAAGSTDNGTCGG